MTKRPEIRLAYGLFCLLPVLAGLLAWNLGVLKRHDTLQDALFLAVSHDDPDTVRELLAQGADPNAVWVDNPQPPTILDLCMQRFGKQRSGSERRFSVLMEASTHNDMPIATMLLNAGADVNAHSADGGTPLLYVASARNEWMRGSLLLFLVEHGADLNATAPDGRQVWQIVGWNPEHLRAYQREMARK